MPKNKNAGHVASKQASPSLSNPDWTGLWSVAHMGTDRDSKWWYKIAGVIAVGMLVGSWTMGFATPVIIAALFYFRYYTIGAVVTAVVAYPYIFEVRAYPYIPRLWLYGAYYFDGGLTMAYEKPLDLEKFKTYQPAITTSHPHGIFSFGFCFNAALRVAAASDVDQETERKICGIRHDYVKRIGNNPMQVCGIVAKSLVYAPLFRHICVKYTGAIQTATPQTVKALMDNNDSFGVTPGAFFEASMFRANEEIIYIKKIKGFIKYALKYGYCVIPSYNFGESHTYWNLPGFENVRKWLSKQRMPSVIFFGRWFCPILPYSNFGIHTIHGNGMQLPKIENPSVDDINKYHSMYIDEIKALFDRHKWRFGMDDTELQIL